MTQTLPSKEIYIIANDIRSLHNVGTLFRIADAIGAKKLYLCGITGYPKIDNDPRRFEVSERADKEIRKTAIKNVDRVSWEYQENIFYLIKKLKNQNIQIVTLEQSKKSQDYRSADYRFPIAVIIGHETEGVDPRIIDLSDLVVEIPMHGEGKSLNAAISLAVLGYEIRKLD